MPDQVFNEWLVERIESAGWPPVGPRWNALLGGYTSDTWATFSWNQEELDLYNLTYSKESIRIIKGLSEARFGGVENAYASIERSEERMRRIHQYVKSTRKLPGSVVLIDGPPWEIIDGCHRITMYVGWIRNKELAGGVDRLQKAWVARPPRDALA
ncbi:hypothetical protein [Methylomonas koyamae]|uniref:hypothetical protein n=1 Tax=Methylomonas koyamae TaxID=702114 RepID=UPI0012F69038|nr:hypothetical protein [Methylomonas koyamae]BBL57227.1 hypothetical protein MKFW12EY_08400 [Methylomonas koyamae]